MLSALRAYQWNQQRWFGCGSLQPWPRNRVPSDFDVWTMELQMLHAMLAQGKPVSRDSMYHLLQHCIKHNDLLSAKQAHLLMLSNDLCLVSPLGDVLIRFFASCGCLLDAYLVFLRVSQPTLYTWHAVISAHAALGHYEQALDLWREMQEHQDIQPDKVAFLCILKTCGSIYAIQQGSLIHKHVIIAGFASVAPIQSALIVMYAKCGSIDDARKVFDEFANKDVVIWGTMIAAYAQHGDDSAALELYMKMNGQGIQPDKVTFLCILKAISSSEEILVGKSVHHEVIMREIELDVILGSTLVDMYAKCGSMEDAQLVFDKLPNRNAVTWNAIIAGYVQHGHGYSALELYSIMQQQGTLKPEKVTFLCTLKACGSIGAVEKGRLLHDQILRRGLEEDHALDNTIIDMYAKCGNIDEAYKLFCNISNREIVSWNSLIAGYTQQGQASHALGLLESMQNVGLLPDMVTCTCALKACASIESLDCGRLIHDRTLRLEVEFDVVIGSALVDMYCKCKSLDEARKVFEKLRSANVVTWNSIISGYVQVEHDHLALELFQQMHHQSIAPNDATFSCILKACSNLGNLEGGKLVHDGIIRCGLEVDAGLVCALVDTYAKCGSPRESRWVFDRLPNRNVTAWAALIGGYVQNDASLNALVMFQKMQVHGIKPDKVTFLCVLRAATLAGAIKEGMLIHDQILRDDLNSDVAVGNTLVDMYAKCGRLYDAHKVFSELPVRDVVSWGVMITGYTQHGDGLTALELFEKMEAEGKVPDRSTFLCVLKACGAISALEQGRVLHEKIVRRAFNVNSAIGNTLVDMYAKCGRMRDANKVFQELSTRDIVSWNAMIAGYAMQGNYELIKLCLKDMQQGGVKPDSWTYTSIIAACSHAGEVQECLAFFESMSKEDDVDQDLEHFNCMIDALGRSGFIEDAEELLHSMPGSPDNIGRVSLLASSKTHGHIDVGSHCVDKILESNQNFTSSNVPMLTNFAESNRMDVIRSGGFFKDAGDRENPFNNAREKGHKSVGEDQDFIDTGSLHLTPSKLCKQMKTTALPNLYVVPNPRKDDRDDRGAIVFGILSSLESINIRCTRILRVPLKCRKTSKLILDIAKRNAILQKSYTIDSMSLFLLVILKFGIIKSSFIL